MPQNMSYCRFSNTLSALHECDDALGEMRKPEDELDESEYKAFEKLVKLCRRIAGDYEDIQ